MKVDFGSLEITGFKCFTGETQVLDLASRAPGLHFLRGHNTLEPALGSNGAGKSSLWDAAMWCLYGRTAKGLRGTDITPWRGTTRGPTEVTWPVTVDGAKHTVTRTLRPSRLLIDGRDAGQEDVISLIGFDFPLCVNAIILAQGQPLFFDLTPKEKLALFGEVLQLDRWERRSALASEQAKLLAQDEAAVSAELTAADTNIARLEQLAQSTQQQLDEWRAAQSARIQGYEEELAELKAQLATLRPKLDKALIQLDGAGTESKALDNEIRKLNHELTLSGRKVDQYKANCNAAAREQARLEQEMEELGDSNTCPKCGQSIKGTDLAAHKAELRAAIKEAESRATAKPPKALLDEMAEVGELLRRTEENASTFRRKMEDAESQVRIYQPQVTELDTKIRMLVANRTERAEEANPHRETLSQLRRQKAQAERDRDALKTELDTLRQRLERTKFWVKGFKDVQLFVVEEVLQELELATNAMLDDMGLVGWEVRYDVEKETKAGTVQRGLNVSILSPTNKQTVRWESWSGGESQRLRLIGALALSEVLLSHAGVQTNLEVLDEPTQHLSPEGRSDLRAFLADRAKQLGKQCWYVDHATVESTHFTSILTVEKTKIGARLISGQ